MSPIKLSERALNTPPSPIRKLSHLARRAKAAGINVYHLNIGQPDIRTPVEFFDGIRKFSAPVLEYGPSEGEETLRQAWCESINATLGLEINASQMLITTGASEGLIFTFMTVCDPGDEVIVFDPTYANYIGFAAISGIKLVPIPSEIERNFAIPPRSEILARITSATHAILLCSPNNPTGTVYSREEIAVLLEICNEKNIFLIVDETYRELVYDGIEPLSVLHLDAKNDRVIVIDSLSKRFSLCGARIGCIITSNEEFLAKTLNQAQARLASPTIEQFAAAHMLRNISGDYLASVKEEYQLRRDVLYESLKQIPEVLVHKPKGAFYTIARIPVADAEAFASYMLSDFSLAGETTFVAPAAGFYMDKSRGSNKIRVAYVLSRERISRAVEVLAVGLKSFQASH